MQGGVVWAMHKRAGVFYGKISLTQEGQASNVIRNLGSEFADYDIPTGCSFKLACQSPKSQK